MNFREMLEENAAYFFFGTLVVGFVAGIGAYEAIVRIAHLQVLSQEGINRLCAERSKTTGADHPSGPVDHPLPSPPLGKTVQSHGFDIQVNRCQRSGNSVSCYLTIVNQENKRDTQLIVPDTMFITGDSQPFRASQVVLVGLRNNSYAQAELLSGSHVNGELVFGNVPQNVSEIHLLKIRMWARDIGGFIVECPGVITIQ